MSYYSNIDQKEFDNFQKIEREIRTLIPSSKESYQKQISKCTYLNDPSYKKYIKPYIANIYNRLQEVPEELKFEGWQQQKAYFSYDYQYNCFQLYFIKFHKSPPKEFWYDGCLIDTFIYEGGGGLKITPIMWFICELHQLPPKEFQYEGWQYYKQLIKVQFTRPNVREFYISLPFFWVTTTKSLLPKELQIPDWKTKKENFIIYDEKDCFCFKRIYGTILDLYDILNLTEPEPQTDKWLDYKISDNGTCYVCQEENVEIYNFCKKPHTEGICLECFNKLQKYKCPLCEEYLNLRKANKQYNICEQWDELRFLFY